MSEGDEINRRQLLKNVAVMTGGVLSVSVVSGILSGALAQEVISVDNPVFKKSELSLVAEMANMIIPDTDTPGAKAALVHENERANFMKGLHSVDSNFMNGSVKEREIIMTELDNEAAPSKTFFEEFKELVLVGYFSSQIGAEEELRYEQYPGPYQGCVPFEKVGRTWAT